MKTLSYTGTEEIKEKFDVENAGVNYTFELTMRFQMINTGLINKGECIFFELTRDNGKEKGIVCKGTNALYADKLISLMHKLGYEMNINFSQI